MLWATILRALPGILMSGAGAAINARIQNSAIAEQNRQNRVAMDMQQRATADERARQLAMEGEQTSIVQRALEAVDPARQAQAVEAEAPNSEIARAAEAYNLASLPGQTASGANRAEIGRIVAEAVQRASGSLAGQARLSALGTGALGMQDTLTQMGGDLNTLGSRRRGSAAVGQTEARIPAASVTPSQSILGDALILMGNLAAGGLGGMPARGAPLNAIPALGPVNLR